MTKTLFRTLALTAAAGAALSFGNTAQAADTYKLDPSHTSVIWAANHFGYSTPHGIFSMIEGTLVLDEAAPEKSTVDVTINTQNLFTGNPKFDDHLKSKDLFNIGEFPTVKFKSTKVEKTGDKTARVTGNLTLLGVEKPVTLDVTYNKNEPNPMSKKPTVGFSAKTVIKRSDWGMKFALPGVADEIPLVIEAEANKDK